ncbi:FixH family protein [Sulfitobacter sp. LCG007]
MIREIRGWHVLVGFTAAFGLIIAVNLALAFNAVRTFPGLEVANSYVASQTFDADRAAQRSLDWDVSAWVDGAERLHLRIVEDGQPIFPEIESAIFGRATSVAWDQEPTFRWDDAEMVADVAAGPGNWNLRLKARGADGILFQQRVIVAHRK